MARLARVVISGMPHHVTQRENRRQQTFFHEEDYTPYLELLAEWCGEEGVEIRGYRRDAEPRPSDCGRIREAFEMNPRLPYTDGGL